MVLKDSINYSYQQSKDPGELDVGAVFRLLAVDLDQVILHLSLRFSFGVHGI